jgi:methyl-accepting chemotaxis protein
MNSLVFHGLSAGQSEAVAVPSTGAEPTLLERVVALRDSTEAAFLSTGSQLIDIATLLDVAKTAALSIDKLAQVDLLNRLRAEADSQAVTFAALSADFAETQSGIRTLATESAALGHDLLAVGRSVVTMRSVVLNARVTLASLSMQDLNLLSFAESGQAVVAEIADLLIQFEQTMDDIQHAVDQTQLMVGQIDATMRTEVMSAFDSLMQDLSVFERGVRAVSGRGADLSRTLQSLIDATGRAVSGLQIGDSTRQQLDHIATILSRPDADDPVFVSLVAALLGEAARANSAMLEQLQTSVGQMTVGLSNLVDVHLSGFFGPPGQTVEAGRLIDGCGRLAQAIAGLSPMQDLTSRLGQSMADKFDAFRGLVSKGEGVQDSTHLIGINAVLSCMRLGQEGAALKVVAEQLQVTSHEVGGRFATIRTALTRINSLGDQITSGTGRLVQQSIQVPEHLIATIVPMIQSVFLHLEPAQQAIARLQDRLFGLSFDFEPANLHRHKLEALAAQAPSPDGPMMSDHIPDATLSQIFAMFTMERERDAFRKVLPDRFEEAAKVMTSDQGGVVDDLFFL